MKKKSFSSGNEHQQEKEKKKRFHACVFEEDFGSGIGLMQIKKRKKEETFFSSVVMVDLLLQKILNVF